MPTENEKTNLRTEAVAGATTFLTMAYIVVVNPAILATEGTGISFSGALTATVLVCFTMTLLMGLYARLPFAVAPGMGLNAFFTYTIILGQGVAWPTALGMIFWAGVFFLIISVTPIRAAVARAIPQSLRIGAAAGIGFFLTFIGLKNAGLIVADPNTLVKFGPIGWPTVVTFSGFLLTVFLLKKKSSLAFLAGIAFITLGALLFGWVEPPEQIFSLPDFRSVFFRLDIGGALKLTLLPAIIAILFTDLFDSLSTFMGVSQAADLLDEDGEPKNLQKGLIVDALATFGAGLFGSSSGTAYIESAAGIEMGGRTGWTSVFTALCFLPCLFIAPLAGMVPPYATSVVLILVGSFMFRSLGKLSFEHLEDVLPVFLTVILIPLTFSITQGILWGFIAHVALYLLAGRGREVHPLMYGLGAVSIGLVWLEHGKF
ncbi:MAG: NCS2 family permease [Pyrinomonadaceae bacterium]